MRSGGTRKVPNHQEFKTERIFEITFPHFTNAFWARSKYLSFFAAMIGHFSDVNVLLVTLMCFDKAFKSKVI